MFSNFVKNFVLLKHFNVRFIEQKTETGPPSTLTSQQISDGFEWLTWPEGSSDYYYRTEGTNGPWIKR